MNLFWLWVLVFQGLIYCGVFGFLLGRYGWSWDGFSVGLLHLFIGIPLAAAPLRCFLDPNYFGYQVGFIKAEGGFACIVALIILIWAIASAFIAVIAPRGRWLLLLVVADSLMFLNHAGIGVKEFANSGFAEFVWQGGQYWRFSGVWLGIGWQLFVTIPLLLSAIWFALRVLPHKTTRAELLNQ